jgi:hypothetical protein
MTANYRLDSGPKNIFYANTEWFITPKLLEAFPSNGVDGPREQVQKLLNELHRGAKLYQLDNSGAGFSTGDDGYQRRNFYDEWAFHKFGQQQTATLTNGEMREFARRRDKVQQAWNLIGDLFKCKTLDQLAPGSNCGPKTVNAMGKVNPGDIQMWEGDPFAFSHIVGSINPEAFLVPPSLSGSVGFGSRLQQSPLTFNQITNVSSGLELLGENLSNPGMVAPTPPDAPYNGGVLPIQINPLNYDAPFADASVNNNLSTIRGYMDLMWEHNPPAIDTTKPYPALDCSGKSASRPSGVLVADDRMTQEAWGPVCNMFNTLSEEWWRKRQGFPSCLDPKKAYCDWTPDMFVDRVVTRYVSFAAAAKERDYNECKRWTAGGKLTDSNTNLLTGIGIDASLRDTPAHVRYVLQKRKENFGDLLSKVPIRSNDHFGKLRVEEERIGNDDFGGGYSYQLGWDLEVFRDHTPNNGITDGSICRVGGNTVAEFEADARLFGHKVAILDARTAISSNQGDEGKAYGDAHLKVVGITFFDTYDDDDQDGKQQGIINLLTRPEQMYIGGDVGGDKKTVFTAAAQVSWVTVTVTVGVYYKYGTTAMLAATIPSADDCTGASFKLNTNITPFAELGVWADVDATIIGFGAGLEVALQLLGLEIPLTTKLELKEIEGQPKATFVATLDFVLSTLKGELSLYIKAFGVKVASFSLVKWKGFEHRFPIFRTKDVAIPVSQLAPGSIVPQGGAGGEQDACPSGKTLQNGVCS